MNILCKLGMHGRKLTSGGRFINLFYCPRCGRPDNNLCHQLLPIEQFLWRVIDDQLGPEWDGNARDKVVLHQLCQHAGYSREVTDTAFYYDIWGYRSSAFGDGRLSEIWNRLSGSRRKPSERAEAAARRLADDEVIANIDRL